MTIIFLVVSEDKVLYHCHSIKELFRLRPIFHTPDDAQVYRYVSTVTYSDAYFTWDKDKLQWIKSSTGVGFGNTSFKALEFNYRLLGGK